MKRLALLLALVVAHVAHAQGEANDTIAYRIKTGETLDVIAAEMYGDHGHAALIVAENKLKRPPRPGDRIRIPVDRPIATDKGDTWASLAATYLGDENRAPFLAQYNGAKDTDYLPTGTVIEIPFRLTHVADGRESLAQIADKYLDDPKQAEVLKKYNALDKGSIEKGDSLIVPVLTVHVRPSRLPPLDADGKARRDEQKEIATAAQTALPAARAAWLQADFAGVRKALEPVVGKTDFLDTPSAIEIGLLAGKAAVAFDDATAANAAFASVLARDPQQQLSAYADSPKVIDAWKKAGGRVKE